jgi:hypothetical protein
MFLLDLVLTLWGQPASYWEGGEPNEGNLLAWWLLRAGPGVFVVVALAWLLVFTVVLCVWRHSWARVAAFLLTLSHGVGAGTWLWRLGWGGMLATVALLVFAERVLTWSWDSLPTDDRP